VSSGFLFHVGHIEAPSGNDQSTFFGQACTFARSEVGDFRAFR
jgi:hypothetical protein